MHLEPLADALDDSPCSMELLMVVVRFRLAIVYHRTAMELTCETIHCRLALAERTRTAASTCATACRRSSSSSRSSCCARRPVNCSSFCSAACRTERARRPSSAALERFACPEWPLAAHAAAITDEEELEWTLCSAVIHPEALVDATWFLAGALMRRQLRWGTR